jgi:hypothetical protein
MISDDLGLCPRCGEPLQIAPRGKFHYECTNPFCDYCDYLSFKPKTKKLQKEKTERSKEKYLLKQTAFVGRMAPIVFEAVKWYVNNNPDKDFYQIEKVFSAEVITLDTYYDDAYVIELANTQIIRINKQWNKLSFDSFIRAAQRIGLIVEHFDNSQENLFVDFLKKSKKKAEGTAKTYVSHIWQIQKHYRENHDGDFLFFLSSKADKDIIIQIMKDYLGSKYHSFMEENINFNSALKAYLEFWVNCIYENN